VTDRVPLVVWGARSYTAGELLRLLAAHPRLTPARVVSRSASGEALDGLQPHVAGCFPDCRSVDPEAAKAYLAETPEAAVALCVGSGEAAPIAAELEAAGLLDGRALVDLTGDHRLRAEQYPRWYGREHPAPELLPRFDYCVPELHRERCSSRLVSNPGCFATAVQLACAPALRAGLVEGELAAFAMTGSSGSGARASAKTHHPARAHDVYAYRPHTHQHLPEVRAGLGLPDEGGLSLVTHSVPIVRGISVTATFQLADGATGESLAEAYRAFAAAEPFLSYADAPPRLAGVIGTNRASLSCAADGGRAAVFCAIDNLGRGAAGQAIQNLNRVHGWDETTGLTAPGLSPA
jgi:N-acetyl-gamma-glutamyl-phosphate reductase